MSKFRVFFINFNNPRRKQEGINDVINTLIHQKLKKK